MDTLRIKRELEAEGFSFCRNLYSPEEVETLKQLLDSVSTDNSSFRKTEDLFAIRRFLMEVPQVRTVLFTPGFRQLVKTIGSKNPVAVRSIYFDKPPASNWFVAWHQDLTISVKEKRPSDTFLKWTNKDGNWAVQAPVELLEKMFTIRIHLDDTDEENGALRIVSRSHKRGYIRPEEITTDDKQRAVFCNTEAGSAMLMKPLLLHSSERTTNEARRRVIHIEFCDAGLLDGLEWSELVEV